MVSVQDVPQTSHWMPEIIAPSPPDALDNLAFQLFLVGPGYNPANERKVAFPIFDDATKYMSQSPGKVHGMSQAAINAIDAAQLYKGGNGHQFWVLSELDNINKHRRLNVAAGAFESANLGSYISEHMNLMMKTRGETRSFPALNLFIRPAERRFPLKPGDILPVHVPDLNKQSDFAFEIAFNEYGVAEGKPMIETLHQLANLVGNVVTQFEPLL